MTSRRRRAADARPTADRVLGFLCVAARVCAALLAVLVVVDALLGGTGRVALLAVNGFATRSIPSLVRGLFVFQTPFGGAFRGDFSLAAIMLLVIDWALSRVRASLR